MTFSCQRRKAGNENDFFTHRTLAVWRATVVVGRIMDGAKAIAEGASRQRTVSFILMRYVLI